MKHSLLEKFVVISPEKRASTETVDNDIYQRLDSNYSNFTNHELLSCYEFSDNWSTWEVHPNGDEVVVLLAGKVTFILKIGEEQQHIELDSVGEYAIIPQGVWHTAMTQTLSKVLFLTPGEGTQSSSTPNQ